MKFLNPAPGDFIIDGTLDGGGHAAAILEKIGPKGKLLGIDLDAAMIARAKINFAGEKNANFVRGNYADLPEILAREKLSWADGLLLDLGFSSDQLENSGRGFSFLKDEPLIMTYEEGARPVRQILRELDEKELAKIIFEFSGEKFAMRIARAIREKGKRTPIKSSRELAEIIREAVPERYERGRIDPATRTFQALRIYANGELENLSHVLRNAGEILRPGGRIVVISFHSLEDRIVKQQFKEMERAGTLEIFTKKPIGASAEEANTNPRSRSAKLRSAAILAS